MNQSHGSSAWREAAGSGAVPSVLLGKLVNAPPLMAFEWNYGDTLPAGLTFVGDANRTKLDATGKVIPVGANVPRNDGYVYDKNGLLQPGWLIEGAATNLLLRSGSIGGTSWTKTGGVLPTVTLNAVTAPDGTLAGTQIDFSTSAPNGVFQSATTASDGTSPYTFSVWLKADAPGTIDLACAGSENGSTVVNVTTSWARYKMTTTAGGGAVAGSYLRRQNTGQLARIYAWGAQLEIGSFPSSYIPTTAATVARAREWPHVPWAYWPQAATFYAKYIDQGTHFAPAAARIFEIDSQGASADPRWLMFAANATTMQEFFNTPGHVQQAVNITPGVVVGDSVEVRATLSGAGSVAPGISVNGGVEQLGGASAGLTLPDNWGATPILSLGADGAGNENAFAAFQSIRLALAIWSMDQMRKVANDPNRLTIATAGAPAASLVSRSGGYSVSTTDLTGTGRIAVIGPTNKGKLY